MNEIGFADLRTPAPWMDFRACDVGLDPYEMTLYVQICRRASGRGEAFLSSQAFAEACCMSRRKLFLVLDSLTARNMIQVVDNPKLCTDRRRRVYAPTSASSWRWCDDSDEEKIGAPHALSAPHAPIQINQCTTCTELGAPHAPIQLSLELKEQEQNNKKDISIPPLPKPTPQKPVAADLQNIHSPTAAAWLEWAQATRPYLASLNLQAFDKAVAQLQARHSITDEGMGKVLRFIQRDPFWSEQAISPCGLLRRSKNGLYKMENLLASMKTDRSWQNDQILTAPEFEGIDF